MQKTTIKNITLISLLFIVAGCKTFFEEDITNQAITLLSPATGIETDIASQTFWWNKVEGAKSYRLQIVTPTFNSSDALILDTLISSDKFTNVLYPSAFEWRVRAENDGYQTQWAINKLLIFSTSDLTRQKVNLIAPGTISVSENIRFQWDGLYNAKNYSFVAYKDKWEGILEVAPTSVDTTFLEEKLNDGIHVWGVKAKNSNSETLYAQKTLIIDKTPPVMAVLSLPSDSSLSTKTTILFTWTSSDLTSGISQDTLKVFSDKNLTKLVKSVVTDKKETEITFTDRIVYYWTVRSVDKAGNVNSASNAYRFTIN